MNGWYCYDSVVWAEWKKGCRIIRGHHNVKSSCWSWLKPQRVFQPCETFWWKKVLALFQSKIYPFPLSQYSKWINKYFDGKSCFLTFPEQSNKCTAISRWEGEEEEVNIEQDGKVVLSSVNHPQTLTALYTIENFIQDDFHICLPYFNCLHYLFSPPVSFSQSQHFRISKETKAAKTLATVPSCLNDHHFFSCHHYHHSHWYHHNFI